MVEPAWAFPHPHRDLMGYIYIYIYTCNLKVFSERMIDMHLMWGRILYQMRKLEHVRCVSPSELTVFRSQFN